MQFGYGLLVADGDNLRKEHIGSELIYRNFAFIFETIAPQMAAKPLAFLSLTPDGACYVIKQLFTNFGPISIYSIIIYNF